MKKHFFVSFLFITFFLEISCQINILKEAENLYLNGEYGSAQNIFISQLNKSEKNDYVLFRIADCSGKLGKSDAYYKKALQIDPMHKGALEYQGELFLQLGKLADAQQNLKKIQKICWLPCNAEKQLEKAIELALKN